MYNKHIPIYQYKEQLIDAIKQYQILVVVGETGSGKTTQLPQYILNELKYINDDNDNNDNYENIDRKRNSKIKIAVTQPRRIAAIAAAQQVCREYNKSRNYYHLLGKEIGYKIRFENVTTPGLTRLTYMTDGVLLREIIDDPLLLNYDIIIIDEAHERSIETDILLGLMKKACQKRSNLKLLVMSATLNMIKFSDFFNECPIFSIPGRLYDIDIYYQKNLNFASLKSKYVSLAVETAINIHKNQSLGHILVFLTGQSEIERACKEMKELEHDLDYSSFPYNINLYSKLNLKDNHILENLRNKVFDQEKYDDDGDDDDDDTNNKSKHRSQKNNRHHKMIDSRFIKGLYIYPIYSVLETRHQKSIFKEVPPGYRKVIFATNIAQTSLTIPGIKYVIDSGFVKQFIYKPELSMDILDITPISKTAAIQRAGRAGRTQNGKVYRLYSKLAYEELEQDTLPEIKRCNLLGSILLLKKLKLKNILDFDFIDKPNLFLEVKAIQELFFLNALDKYGRITKTGNLMADFPTSPYLAKLLLSSIKYKCSAEMIIIVSMLSVEDVYITPRGQKKQDEANKAHSYFHHISGDHMTMLNIYKQWASSNLGQFSKEWCKKYFLHYRALVTAKNIKGQLELIFKRLKLPILSCNKNKIKRNNNNDNNDNNSNNYDKYHHHHHRHRHHSDKKEKNENENEKGKELKEDEEENNNNNNGDDNNDDDDDDDVIYDKTMKNYDYTLILKSVCQAYYMNVAKRITNRPYFYNYKHSTSDTLIKLFNNNNNNNNNNSNKQQELVPLFIHPSSSIHSSSHSQDAHYLEWVIYHHTLFTNRCYLRHVSIINFDWVKDLLEIVDNVDYSKLLEKDVKSIVASEKKNEESEEEEENDDDDEETLNKKRKNKDYFHKDKDKINNDDDDDDDDEDKDIKKKKRKINEKEKGEINNNNINNSDSNNEISKSESTVEDSRKAALQRYLQRKQLKEMKNKKK
ncbi:P-loop containing nucleoside triphosphate hydrolase protein [Anaeromyces robustus]|uniref:p-loop containing nucleoside triphosphate hydrolase protein n=1 Tax=Anaeromyces robustus TaxID=1754192 RepID=A0A1Y1XEG9_9FUNG|nr:P-loop containing nucleoside triphosphate hydrolase protein [Anaeromyces robustus]|eukprot:ORX83836.1 P-loop containing nucleoside triphosphate hydrolase protein [Anaeromyces robustus]